MKNRVFENLNPNLEAEVETHSDTRRKEILRRMPFVYHVEKQKVTS